MDLVTRYLGMDIRTPLVPSASPLARDLDSARRLEDAGAGALIMHSLFEEAVRGEEEGMSRFLHEQETGFGEAQSFLPAHWDFEHPLDDYLDNLRRLKEALEIPVVASLNGVSPGGWIKHAEEIQAAGADALELNVYYVPTDPDEDSAQVERRYIDLLQLLRGHLNLPINMKLSPWFSALPAMVRRLERAGASGVALFNRFYQPDINIDSLRLQPSLHPSTSGELLLPMRWIALLHGRTELSLGATSGIHTATDAIKLLLAGTDVVHLCSALLVHGPGHLETVLAGIREWMDAQGFESIDEFRGRLSYLACPDLGELVRTSYIRILDSYSFSPGVMT